MGVTLCEAPTRETRPDHNTGNYVPYSFRLAIVFTRAAPAFEELFNTFIWFLLDINTAHTTVKKETFQYLLKLTSM